MFTCTTADTLNVSVTVFANTYGWDSNQLLLFSAVGSAIVNIPVSKLIMPIVIGIRSFAFFVVPMMLAMAGANQNAGYRNAFILCAVLSLISTILAFALKGNCIGKQND